MFFTGEKNKSFFLVLCERVFFSNFIGYITFLVFKNILIPNPKNQVNRLWARE